VTLVDTSAIYALVSEKDGHHAQAEVLAARLAATREPLLVHTYALCEAFALVHRRLGPATAEAMDAGLRSIETVVVDRALHDRAVARWAAGDRRRWSLVDAVSFEVMEERGIDTAFAFDPDFERAGFRLYGSG
jgi:predicted nucleic acid-binding protein